MSAIEALIKTKKQGTNDDLIKFLDELILYEKLAKSETFRDLRTSTAAQKKLPLLSGAYTGNLYSVSLCQMVVNILNHLDGDAPDIVKDPIVAMTEKDLRRLEILQRSVIRVSYRALNEYDHERQKDHVVGIFTTNTSDNEDQVSILIVVKENEKYFIYQGFYQNTDSDMGTMQIKSDVYRKTEGTDRLEIQTYSLQGNNAYPFGVFYHGNNKYQVMMPYHDLIRLTLINGEDRIKIPLTTSDINRMNMSKTEIQTFSECLMDLIRKGFENEKDEGNTGKGIETDSNGDEDPECKIGCGDTV